MTRLAKPIRRVTALDPKLGRKEAGDVTVTLYPGGVIGFRKLRRRQEVTLTLDACYAAALKAEARNQAQQKKLNRRRK